MVSSLSNHTFHLLLRRLIPLLLLLLLLVALLPQGYCASLQVLEEEVEKPTTTTKNNNKANNVRNLLSKDAEAAPPLLHSSRSRTRTLNSCSASSEEISFKSYIQIQTSSAGLVIPTTTTTSTSTDNSTTTNTTTNTQNNGTTTASGAQEAQQPQQQEQRMRDDDDTVASLFVTAYNDYSYNYSKAFCTTGGENRGTVIDAARIIPVEACGRGGGGNITTTTTTTLLEVNATTCFGGCLGGDIVDNPSPLRVFRPSEDSSFSVGEDGNETSHNVSITCFCDPPSPEGFAEIFQQILLEYQDTTLPTTNGLPVTGNTALNYSSSSLLPLLTVTATTNNVDITEFVDGVDCESSSVSRDYFETNMVLYLDCSTSSNTDDLLFDPSAPYSSQQLSLLLLLLEEYVINAYDASNRLREDLCDPWGRQIESVNVSVRQDLDDVVYPAGRGVKHKNTEGGGDSTLDNRNSTTTGLLLQITLSYYDLFGGSTTTGDTSSSQQVVLTAFDDFASTAVLDSDMILTYSEEAGSPSCLRRPSVPDSNETYFVRGPTREEFQQELASILMQEDMDTIDAVGYYVLSPSEVATVPCAATTASMIDDNDNGSLTTNITEVVLVDYIVRCSLVDDDVAFLADKLVEVYNTLSKEEYCDPHFRKISSAKVLRRGETRLEAEDTSVLTIEIELNGTCIGCNPILDGFYDVPATISTNNTEISINPAIGTEVVTNMEVNSTDMNSTRPTNNTNATTNGTDVNNNPTRHQRSLKGTRPRYSARKNSVCYCPTSAVAARAPSEAEVMDSLRGLVQGVQDSLRCVSSVGECQFGTSFESSFLVAFGESNATLGFTTELEVALQDTLNGLFFIPGPGVCRPDFRLVQSVSTTVVIGLADDEVRRHLSSSKRKIQEDDSEELNTISISSAPSTSTAPAMTLTLNPTPFPTINLPSIGTSATTTPTASPTIELSNFVLVLLSIRGVCNGCSNDLLAQNEISSIVSRKLENDNLTNPFSRSLQTQGTEPDSNCFCPIESVVEEAGPSVDVVLDAYQDQLEDLDIPVDVQGIEEVQVLDCQNEIEDFEAQIVLPFSLNLEVSNRELVQLVEVIQETYNELTDQEYCDPLIRRIENLDFVSMERLEVGQNGCDLIALTFDVVGRCRGCGNDSTIFDNPQEGERRRMRQDDSQNTLLFGNIDLDIPASHRQLQASELCLCERNTRADRAPSLEEFELALAPKIERNNFILVCGLADVFEEIRITGTPSSSPSDIPSESPSECSISLENEFATEMVIFVENGDKLDAEVANQLGHALEMAYNDIVQQQYGVCDPLYRVVMSVTLIDVDMSGRRQRTLRQSTTKGLQHNQESLSSDHSTKYSPPRSGNSRTLQEDGLEVPFRYAITGQCAGCNSDANILDVLTTEEVLPMVRDLAAPFVDREQLLDMKEVDEIVCSDMVVEFDKLVIVELVPSCPEEENFGFEGVVLSRIEETFVSTYNQLATLYCDKFFRKLVGAKVESLGTITNEGNIPVEIRVFAQCLGCSPDEVSIYGDPSTLESDESDVVVGDANRSLQSVHGKRLLQSLDRCVCSAQALANRSPSESEFINAFRRSIESLPLDCVVSVGECEFGSTFDTDIVISFEGNQTSLTDDVRLTIQESFQTLLNELYEPSEEVCDPSFRVILDVEVVFDFTLNGEVIESSGNLTTDNTPSDRFLSNSDMPHQRGQGFVSRSLDLSVSPSPGRKAAFEVAPNQTSPPTSSALYSNSNQMPSSSPSSLSRPTPSPTISFANTNIVRTLLTVSGICNGCLNELFSSNQILTGLNRRGLGQEQNDDLLDGYNTNIEFLLGRHLQDERGPNSNCFCPLTAIVNIIPPSTEEVQIGLNRRLVDKDVDLVVQDIDTVSAIDCDAEEETTRFESKFTFHFSALASVLDREIQQLGAVIEIVYNDLVQDYCDPLIRREIELRLTNRRRTIASNFPISGRRDLQEAVGPTLEQEPPCVNFEATFDVKGLCRGCQDGTPLLDNQRTRASLSKFHDRILSRDQPLQKRTRRRRLINDEAECFCDSSTIAPRAPNVDELWFRLKPKLESLVGICGEPVECDPTSFPSEFAETTILALLLEPGTIVSEVEILEIEGVYMKEYNEIQTRLRADKCGGFFRQLTSISADKSILGEASGQTEERSGQNLGGGGRRLDVQSFVFATAGGCTRECRPGDDVDILRAMIDPIRSVSFVREVLAVNEFLTGAPSSSPSQQPSVAPSMNPSISPSTSPSTAPSGLPSSFPSEFPSEYPSGLPSTSPSTLPSTFPSLSPSTSPSTLPSTSPSTLPSVSPSKLPSGVPSVVPSTEPSSMPSMNPSFNPSSVPSVIPSLLPSVVPSGLPSMQPSGSPSFSPSVLPSLLPSSRPSSIPSMTPSLVPSFEPSQTPSAFPSPSATCSPLLCNELNPALPTPITCTANPFCLCSSPTCPNCIGTINDPCSGANGPIGDNSCLGNFACVFAATDIGDNSCQGANACNGVQSSIGSNSCNGADSCEDSAVAIPNNSCNADSICLGCQFAITSGQCNDVSDFSSCPCLPTFGEGSCVDIDGESTCFGDALANGGTAKSVIGTASCTESRACIQLNDATIGDNSCNAGFACETLGEGVTIGNNACNGINACSGCTVDVLDNQCNANFGGPDCPC